MPLAGEPVYALLDDGSIHCTGCRMSLVGCQKPVFNGKTPKYVCTYQDQRSSCIWNKRVEGP